MSVSMGDDGAAKEPQPEFLVVGIGGSAGSIPSFREFFRNVPADSGVAYVVILHLSPSHESKLAEVLQASSQMPVTQVADAVRMEPNHVYVIPPNKSLSVNDGSLVTSEITGFEERRAPVDIFFRALADTHDSRAVCIILSGTGADGSMGLRRIKEYNGLVLVQDPAEAEFSEMPRNAIATGLVDFVVPVAEMPRKIVSYRDQLRYGVRATAEHTDEDEQALIDVFTRLRLRTGHDFMNYKRATVLRRIERRLAVREIASLPEYARFLCEHPEEGEALLRELLISVTNFFRDKNVWEKVERTLIPRLLAGKGAEDHVRVWVPGCATGEEAYSIAMLLADAASHLSSTPDIQIFATDLDADAIARARNGFYSSAETADISPEHLRRFFTKEPEGYRVRRELRELVLFAHHNLIKDPPFSHLDFVSCRNVLIYLNRTAQQRAMEVLHFALEPGGYLLLGTAESAEGAGQLFSVVDKEAHIFQSRAVARVMPIQTPPQLTVATDLRNASPLTAEPREHRTPRLTPVDLHQRLLEEYAPPSLIVDEQYDIVHLTDRAGRYLAFAGGEGSLNLLNVVRPELRIDLRTALAQAARNRSTVIARGLVVDTGERAETVNVIVRPALREGDPARGLFLVLFEESSDSPRVAQQDLTPAEPAARQLEEELVRIKAQMRSSIEQYEVQAEEAKAANEELQAMNEELRSTAEELETSQEELQSVNEELQTVNQELKVKIDEISHANNDMRNLMSSTEIGTIFVDRGLRVKLFTPRVRDIFNLIPADVGRPLMDITNKLTVDHLTGDVELVLERLQTIEREVETRDGRWHLMRLLPYRTAEDRIDGVVLTFVDITQLKRAEATARRSGEELEQMVAQRNQELRETSTILQSLVNASPLAILSLDREHRVQSWNPAAEKMFGWTSAEVLGKPVPNMPADLAELIRRATAAAAGTPPPAHDARWSRKDGRAIDVHVLTAPVRDANGSAYATMAIIQDVTARTTLEAERAQLLRRIVQSQEDERQRIARELHDELGQHLVALTVALARFEPAGEAVEQMKAIVARLDESVDRLTVELRPPALDDVGLPSAITSLLNQFSSASGIHTDMHTTGSDGDRVSREVETALYRVLQEGLTNVWKHAEAKNVSVILERHPDHVQLILEDDGQGFDESDAADDPPRFGLLGMRERLALIGGTLSIESIPGAGTSLYVRVPATRAGARS